jgi:pimeloyl-ACP methyl ester carboxylesterase
MHTWILLRGLTREAAHWGPFPGVLQATVPDAKIVLLDLPGNGQFHQSRSPVTVNAMVQACRSELAQRGIAPPYRLLALSLGAMVAIEWARSAPDAVAGCVLINTSVRPFSPFFHRLRPCNYPKLLGMALTPYGPRSLEERVWELTSNQRVPQAGTVADWTAVRRARPVARGNALRQLVAAARFRAPLAAPCPNTLVLASQADGLVDVRCSQALARAWACPLALHPWAGHDLPLDDPDWVAAQIGQWGAQTQRAP